MHSIIAVALGLGRFGYTWILGGPSGIAIMVGIEAAIYMVRNASRVKKLRLMTNLPFLAARPHYAMIASLERPALDLKNLSTNKDFGNVSFEYQGVAYEVGILGNENGKDRLVIADVNKRMLLGRGDVPRELDLLLKETANMSLLLYY